MKLKDLLFILLTIGIMSSCSKFGFESEEVKKIDSLSAELDRVLQDFRSVDTATLFNQYEEVLSNTKYIQKFNIDTLPLKMAQHLSEYYSMRRHLESYKNYNKIEEELLIGKQQLEDLKHDFKNDIISDKKFREYYTIESNNYLKLESKVQAMLNSWERFQEKYPKYNPKVDSLVKDIKNRRNNLQL